MSVAQYIKNNQKLKLFVHYMLVPKGEARPRLWVKWLVNPWVHKRGKSAKIRSRVRLDVLPFNKFQLNNNSTIEDFCTINNGVGDVFIGENSLVGMGNVIIGPVTIGDNVIMAQNVVMSGLNHNYEDISLPISQQGVTTKPITISDNCWLGANVVIVSGVTLGRHCVVGAGSVVTKSLPDYSVAVGNPAKIIRKYDASLKEWVKV